MLRDWGGDVFNWRYKREKRVDEGGVICSMPQKERVLEEKARWLV